MKKDPVKAVGVMVIILGIVMVILVFSNSSESGDTPEWFHGVFFLFCSMCVVSAAIKHMAKRIDELEKKLNTNQTEEDA